MGLCEGQNAYFGSSWLSYPRWLPTVIQKVGENPSSSTQQSHIIACECTIAVLEDRHTSCST
eukprot:5294804-Amphidinium_carterae.3